MKIIPVVLFGDLIAAYGVIRALGPLNIPIYIVSKKGNGIATKSRYIKDIYALEANDANFIEKLNGWLLKKVGGNAVLMIAGVDDYLDTLSKNINKLLPNLKLTFPEWKIVKTIREKAIAYRIAEQIGIPVPKTFLITSQNELEDSLKKIPPASFPLLMKAEDSSRFLGKYGTKGIICNNSSEVIDNYKMHNNFYNNLLLQEMIPGGENMLFNFITVLNTNSDPVAVFMNKKIRSSKQFLNCTLMETMWSEEVLAYSLNLLKKIGYIGYANTEFKYDTRDNSFKFIEINGRISMSNSHALKCGINLPLLIYKESLEGPLAKQNEFRKTYSDKILWWYLEEDIRSIITTDKKNRISLREFFRSIVGKKCAIEPMFWLDPLPGFISLFKILTYTLKFVFYKIPGVYFSGRIIKKIKALMISSK